MARLQAVCAAARGAHTHARAAAFCCAASCNGQPEQAGRQARACAARTRHRRSRRRLGGGAPIAQRVAAGLRRAVAKVELVAQRAATSRRSSRRWRQRRRRCSAAVCRLDAVCVPAACAGVVRSGALELCCCARGRLCLVALGLLLLASLLRALRVHHARRTCVGQLCACVHAGPLSQLRAATDNPALLLHACCHQWLLSLRSLACMPLPRSCGRTLCSSQPSALYATTSCSTIGSNLKQRSLLLKRATFCGAAGLVAVSILATSSFSSASDRHSWLGGRSTSRDGCTLLIDAWPAHAVRRRRARAVCCARVHDEMWSSCTTAPCQAGRPVHALQHAPASSRRRRAAAPPPPRPARVRPASPCPCRAAWPVPGSRACGCAERAVLAGWAWCCSARRRTLSSLRLLKRPDSGGMLGERDRGRARWLRPARPGSRMRRRGQAGGAPDDEDCQIRARKSHWQTPE